MHPSESQTHSGILQTSYWKTAPRIKPKALLTRGLTLRSVSFHLHRNVMGIFFFFWGREWSLGVVIRVMRNVIDISWGRKVVLRGGHQSDEVCDFFWGDGGWGVGGRGKWSWGVVIRVMRNAMRFFFFWQIITFPHTAAEWAQEQKEVGQANVFITGRSHTVCMCAVCVQSVRVLTGKGRSITTCKAYCLLPATTAYNVYNYTKARLF